MINLKIDPEFQNQIPPLTDDEYKQLEENILKEGKLLSPLIVWNNTLVDFEEELRLGSIVYGYGWPIGDSLLVVEKGAGVDVLKLVAPNISTKSSIIQEMRSWIVLPAKSLNIPRSNLLVLGISSAASALEKFSGVESFSRAANKP